MTNNPLIARAARRGKSGHGSLAEKKLSKRLGGRLTPASGALEGSKGDIVLPDFLVECKSTDAGSLRLKYEWLIKISDEAASKGRIPALAVQFVMGTGHPFLNGSWIMVPESTFLELTEK